MEQIMYNNIINKEYIGIITVLDYETPVTTLLQNICLCNIENSKGKKVLIDLLIKSGDSKYRFMTFDFSTNGKISLSTGNYVIPSDEIIHKANLFWKNKREFLQGSIITPSIQEMLFA